MKQRCPILALLLTMVLLVSSVGTVYAAPESVSEYPVAVSRYAEPATLRNAETVVDPTSDAYQAVLAGFMNMEETINLRSYSLSVDEVYAIVQHILNYHSRVFHLGDGYSVSTSNATGNVVALQPTYTMDQAEYTATNAAIDAEEAAVIAMANGASTDAEKALLVHDYICANFEYDLTFSYYDIGHFVTERTGVCQAYAIFYREIMNRLGIPCEFAASTAANHIWNMVKIDGKWYHVDVTSDDPTGDLLGLAHHEYFLLSDSALLAKESKLHPSWKADYVADDTRYDGNRAWKGMVAPFVISDGTIYTVNLSEKYRPQVCSYDMASDTLTVLATVSSDADIPWYVWGATTTAYAKAYSGMFAYEGSLIFHSAAKIYAYQPSAKTLTVIATPDTSEGYIYGMHREGDQLAYATTTRPSFGHYNETEPDTYRLCAISLADLPIPEEQPAILLGDYDNSGTVNAKDVTMLRRGVANHATTAEHPAGDMDGNGILNAKDVTMLRRAIANK